MNKDKVGNPKVAVLMAAYNGMQWIEEQVFSILHQERVNVTLFISVDLSTDGTEQWVYSLANEREDVVMLPYGCLFGGAGPNFFRLIKDVDFEDFDCVAFSDQDDIWFPEKIADAHKVLRDDECDVYSSNVTAFWSNGKQYLVRKSQPQKKYDYFFEAAGPGCTYVFNIAPLNAFKQFLMNLGENTEKIAMHDWLAYAFCRNRGFKWHIDDKPSLLYRQHGENQVGTNTGFRAYVKRLSLIKQHWYREQVEVIAGLIDPGILSDIEKYSFRIRNFYHMRRRLRDAVFLLFIFLFRLY